jgi:hypothetical protein
VTRERDDGAGQPARDAQMLDDREPVPIGERQVEQEQLGDVGHRGGRRGGDRVRGRHTVSRLLEQHAQGAGDERAVVDEQDVRAPVAQGVVGSSGSVK